MSNNKLTIGLVIAIVIAIGGWFTPLGQNIAQKVGGLGAPTNYDQLGVSQLKIGSTCNNSFGYAGCSGTALNGLNFGVCQVQASANTITASTTVTVDCVLAAGTPPGTPLLGITAGDTVTVQQGTTTPTLFEGLEVRGASASSTPGYITMSLYNGTGATFTWTSAASTSFKYFDAR